MNIVIDIKNKMIEIDGNIKVSELNRFMKEHNFDPEQYSVRSKVSISLIPSPTYIPNRLVPHPTYPMWGDHTVYCKQS